jgi:hypothetical protein
MPQNFDQVTSSASENVQIPGVQLESGRFLWPSPADSIVAISAAQLAYMLDGIDWRNPVHVTPGGRRLSLRPIDSPYG